MFSSAIHAQTAISGILDFQDQKTTDQKVYLYKLDLEGLKNPVLAKEVAWSSLDRDGSFSFNSKHIAVQDAVYQLHLNGLGSKRNDTITKSRPFILSRGDHIEFQHGAHQFAKYSTSNLADKEWKRLQDFDRRLQKPDYETAEDKGQRKGYIKDSLRILIVKLIGIQQLEDKSLLDQDIAKNPEYYLNLLDELKASEMPSSQYLFLEKKLAFLTQKVLAKKYAWSKTVNIVLVMVFGLILFSLYTRKRSTVLPELSKQERTVKNLILEGKSNKEIANELFISLSTVKTHITNIYGKLKVSNRQELLQKTQN
ncbi:helix-turn-helix domain-containing protein [Spongiimicrobium sp. 3-5]|uniref:helix-turn-helix domain-containing protein n=1 Tax=Spongiimicrobium sp. 3-5 TaxID=3332596 RepID=UPI00397FACEA